MSIKDYREKINPQWQSIKERLVGEGMGERYFTGAIIILVGASSFGLGRLSAMDEQREPIMIEESASQIENTETSPPNPISSNSQSASVIESIKTKAPTKTDAGGKFVASRNGTKYYFPWCGGVSKIAEANKIWFNSEADAKAKGYGPAANCKGLR